MSSPDFGQYRSIYVAVIPPGEILDQTDRVVADEDAIAWCDRVAELRGGTAPEGFCVVAIRQTVGQPDKVISSWGNAEANNVDLPAV